MSENGIAGREWIISKLIYYANNYENLDEVGKLLEKL